MLKLIPQPDLKPSPQDGVKLQPGDSVPNLAVPRKLAFHGFFANLKYLLTERHPRIPDHAKAGVFLPRHSRASLVDNLKEFFRPAPKFANDEVKSLTGAASPGIKAESHPLYLSLFRNIREVILPPKLPPLELTSKPVDVPDIWSKQKAFTGSRAVSAFLHASLIAAALVWSVRQVTTLDAPKTVTVLVAPPLLGPSPPLAPTAAPPAAALPPAMHRAAYTKRKSFFVQGKLTAPTAIPKVVSAQHTVDDAGVPDLNLRGAPGGGPGGVPGGVLGGVPGGIPGGILGGAPGAPPSAPKPSPGILRIGGDLKRPKEIYTPPPEYPDIARRAHVSGSVFLDAVLDEHGNVVKLHPVSGHAFLVSAALKAVSRWKYEPTYLNGVPVPVAMEVEVKFNLPRD